MGHKETSLFLGGGFGFQSLEPICIQHPPSDFLIDMRRDFLLKCPDQGPVFECAARRPRWRQIICKVSEPHAVGAICQTYKIIETLLADRDRSPMR
jgi:hypothetical protein